MRRTSEKPKKQKARVTGTAARRSSARHAPVAMRVILTHDFASGCYVAEVPDIQGCVTGGDTREEALRMAYDAIECCLHGSDDINPKPLPKGATEEWLHLAWVTSTGKPLKLSYLRPVLQPRSAEMARPASVKKKLNKKKYLYSKGEKAFDCVEMKRAVQAEIYEETKGMTLEHEREYLKKQLKSGPLAKKWAELQSQQKKKAK
jgi:predicted RNase H-like HicB family nuclease